MQLAPVLVIPEEVATLDPAHHHVVHGPPRQEAINKRIARAPDLDLVELPG